MALGEAAADANSFPSLALVARDPLLEFLHTADVTSSTTSHLLQKGNLEQKERHTTLNQGQTQFTQDAPRHAAKQRQGVNTPGIRNWHPEGQRKNLQSN